MNKNLYIETYGCQMNIADSEVIASVMAEHGYSQVQDITRAGIILINTCSIRENAEQKIWNRLKEIRSLKRKNRKIIVGLTGCMAERLKEELLEKELIIDIIAGPDAYRDLPALAKEAENGRKAVNITLSRCETYSDISPAYDENGGISAFIPIMRGCNNMCSYCVVPYVRGAERSRDPDSILKEAGDLVRRGFREITLLGQNVDSYKYISGNQVTEFHHLIEKVAMTDRLLRVRFTTSHPKDISQELLRTIARNKNICRHIHLPVQSGSSRILQLMNRGYTREDYFSRISAIRNIIPDCSISTDIITGFCTETEEDHEETLSLMKWAEFDFAYMFRYSERPGTRAARRLKDDVPEEIKLRRLNEIISLQNSLSKKSKRHDIGKVFEVLTEGFSKRSADSLTGRTSQNKVVVFPGSGKKKGDYVNVLIEDCTSATLKGRII
ncbi:MAG TPA: tRNA (N6-isopentenyl adenosine(37)-C2)-methylthiotransferase MiaB [Bacteroidales bacterium]|jgi:tRNA-2-methylthio-N6-dimethylallyladenosine synthase|nr:tRNA (N6-isopentenyl adenosine(37)-C2)-methylthiotransferase MiaB [Bacteroidales bacterium]